MTLSVPSDKITRERVAKVAELADDDPAAIREFLDGKFRLFANVVTYRWLEPKPEEWFPFPDHAADWHRHLHEGDYSPMILSGRKHTKTTWVLCEILYHHQYVDHWRTLYWCNNATNQLVSRMTELEEMIEANLWLDNLHRGNPDNQNNIPRDIKEKNFPNGSTLYGTGVGGGIEGSHVNMVIGDDPLKELGDIPDEDIVDFYQKVIVPMADSSDLNVIVGTRKRPKDIYHLIREVTAGLEEFDISGYQLIEYPAVREAWVEKYGDRPENLATGDLYTTEDAPQLAEALGLPGDTVDILWSEGRGPKFLLGKLARQGKPSFMREFCMVFTHVEDAIIKRELIDGPPVSIDDSPPVDWSEIEERDIGLERIAVGIDPAVVEGSDNNAWATVGVDGEGTRYVLDVTYNDGLSPRRIREETISLWERYEPAKIVWESNGWQEWLAEEQVQFPDYLPMEMAGTTQRKHSWQSGVPAIADMVESGQYRFFRDDEGTEDLVDALCSLRMDDNDHLSGHTPDVVMALYMAEKGLAMGQASSSRGSMDSSGDPEQDAKDRETRRELQQSEIGRAILDSRDSLY